MLPGFRCPVPRGGNSCAHRTRTLARQLLFQCPNRVCAWVVFMYVCMYICEYYLWLIGCRIGRILRTNCFNTRFKMQFPLQVCLIGDDDTVHLHLMLWMPSWYQLLKILGILNLIRSIAGRYRYWLNPIPVLLCFLFYGGLVCLYLARSTYCNSKPDKDQ